MQRDERERKTACWKLDVNLPLQSRGQTSLRRINTAYCKLCITIISSHKADYSKNVYVWACAASTLTVTNLFVFRFTDHFPRSLYWDEEQMDAYTPALRQCQTHTHTHAHKHDKQHMIWSTNCASQCMCRQRWKAMRGGCKHTLGSQDKTETQTTLCFAEEIELQNRI